LPRELFLRKEATQVPEVHSPAVRRLELGAVLRALRNATGLTVEQVADRLLCSPSKVSRMETGQGAAARDIRDLCDLYGVADPAERDRLMSLAKEGKRPARWQRYDLAYARYAELEEEAVAISAFQSSVVHGLLHTADYARANHESSSPRLDPHQIDLQIEAKLARQRILTQADPAQANPTQVDPPGFAVVLDEAALHRMVGGRRVMAAQLDKILDMSALPNVTVQVLPFELGAHPALESNFTILQLPRPTPGVVFVEGMIGSTYLDRPGDLRRYQEIFGKLQSIALNSKDTSDLIAKFLLLYKDDLDAQRDPIDFIPAGR